MSRVSVFDSPFLLGFDHFERVLDRVSKSSAEGYPPYNIEQISDEELRITLAVAGFAMGCLLYTSPSPRDVEESRMPSSA